MLPLLLFAQLSIDLRDWPVRIGPEAQLFVDDHLIAKRSNVDFQVHSPRKHPANPILEADKPRESYLLVYGSTIHDKASNKFRMWYTNNIGIAYAESTDGVRFTRPGNYQLTQGHRGRSDTLTIFQDPTGLYRAYVMEYRYPDKDGIREQRREGIYLRTSKDGIQWDERHDPVMYSAFRNAADQLPGAKWDLGDVHHIAWDPKLNKYIGHIKLTYEGVRMRGMAESDDGVYWSDPRLILKADEQDRPGDQLYSMIAFPYESAWIGFLGVYHKGTDERMDIQLVTSRDGRHWSRHLRSPFLPNGPDNSWDWGILHMGQNPPIRVNDELRIYYGGGQSAHNVRLRDAKRFGIGLATLRPEGFVSLDAKTQPGEIVTRPLHSKGTKLTLNAAVQPQGSIQVALLNPDGTTIAESEPVTGDSLRAPVRWKTVVAIPTTKDYRLQFRLNNASLYAFRVE